MRSFAHRLRVASDALIILVPFVLCVLLYLPTFAGGLLSDDYSVLGALAGWSRDGELIASLARKFWSGLDAPNHYYRPLAMVSFALNFATSGAAPLGWRLTNLAIHLASGGLVAVIVARFFAAAPPWLRTLASASAAAVFLLFPTSVEAAAWVSGRYDLLATLFMLATVACFQRARRWGDRWGVSAIAWAACAFASKESAALLPFLILALAVARRENEGRAAFLRGAWDAAPWLAMGIIYFALRAAIFGTPFSVYAGNSPVASLLGGGWLDPLASSGAWIASMLMVPLARRCFFAGIGVMLVLGLWRCRQYPRARAFWLAIAASALLSFALLLPHLHTMSPNGEDGRLLYTTAALVAMLCGFAWVRNGTAPGWSGCVAIAGTVAILLSEVVLLRAAAGPWAEAGRQVKQLIAGLATTARETPEGGYGLVVVADRLGSVPFARNAQGGLVSPPVQATELSRRLIVQTPAELPLWPADIARGVVDALRRYPLAEAWSAVAEGRVTPGGAPTAYLCWSSTARQIVPLALSPPGATDWLAEWRRALSDSACRPLLRELPE